MHVFCNDNVVGRFKVVAGTERQVSIAINIGRGKIFKAMIPIPRMVAPILDYSGNIESANDFSGYPLRRFHYHVRFRRMKSVAPYYGSEGFDSCQVSVFFGRKDFFVAAPFRVHAKKVNHSDALNSSGTPIVWEL